MSTMARILDELKDAHPHQRRLLLNQLADKFGAGFAANVEAGLVERDKALSERSHKAAATRKRIKERWTPGGYRP
jgi:hypothetical protein